MPMWFICSCSSACCCNISEMMMQLPFMMMPSITVMSFLKDQYGLISWWSWSLLSSHPTIIKDFNHCRSSSHMVTCCICWIDMHSGTLANVCTASTITSIPLIASSLFSLWLCWDSQSAIKISGSSLHITLILYWCFLSRMHWILCDRVTTSFLNIAIRGLWYVITCTSLAKQ